MTIILSKFESALVAYNPVIMYRLKYGSSVQDLTGNNVKNIPNYIANINSGNAGAKMTPSAGIFDFESMRFTGQLDKNAAQFSLPAAVKIPNNMTVVVVMSNMRNVDGSKVSVGVFSCLQSSGWAIYTDQPGAVGFCLYTGSNFNKLYFDNSILSPNGNLVHATFDGLNIAIYVNGAKVSSNTLSTQSNIIYGGTSFMAIGSDVDNAGTTVSECGDVDISIAGVYNSVLSDAQISAQYEAYSSVKSISGTALLSNGAAASQIIICNDDLNKIGSVIPGGNGSWSANVEDGEYYVTALGPSGYRPLTHGPVAAG